MTNNQLTKEWLQQTIAELESVRDEIPFGIDTNSELELAAFKLALTAMDSEPVAWTDEEELRDANESGCGYLFGIERDANKFADPRRQIMLYRHPQPAPVVMDDEKLRALFDAWFASDCSFDQSPEASEADNIAWRESYWYVWQRCRAAMLQAEPVTTACKLPFEQWLSQQTGTIGVECGCVMTEVFFHWLRVAYEAGNSPVIPDTWIPVSERLPEEGGRYWCYVEEQNDLGKSHYQWNCSWNGERWWVESENGGIVTHWMPLPAAPQEVKGE